MDKLDLIDRGALLEAMRQHGNRVQGLSGKWETAYSPGVHLCVLDAEDAPAVDAEPVHHGAWIDIYPASNSAKRCSACRTIRVINRRVNNWLDMRYCPHCGARMDAKEDTP